MKNIYDASAEELDAISALEGHGYEIVRYRDERGGFSDLRQLDEVPGLSGKVPDDAGNWLTIDGAVDGGTGQPMIGFRSEETCNVK